ncbi:MAG: hypothetical protein K2O18_00305 [Oscillospiraceae bacterium]|nr:hypothetical protein [Oscillospiraceae bacterium]
MKIICIMGKSGSGKSTLEAAITRAGYSRIISYTTRKPRGDERDGQEYHFVSKETFEKLIENGVLMEYAEYSGNLYGAPKPSDGNYVVVVEPRGYKRIKDMYPDETMGVYILLPAEIIAERIFQRNDTSAGEAARRIAEDMEVFRDMEEKVDLVLDGRAPVRESAELILSLAEII